MKLYWIQYVDEECGRIEAFTNKAEAAKRHNEINRLPYVDQNSEEVYISEFPITAKGIAEAFSEGARLVTK